jgi:hypothetical protein
MFLRYLKTLSATSTIPLLCFWAIDLAEELEERLLDVMDGKTVHENAIKIVHSPRRPGKEPDRSVKWLVWRDARTDFIVHWQRGLWDGWAPATFRKYCVLLQQRWQDFSRRAPEIHTLLDQSCKLHDSFGTKTVFAFSLLIKFHV